MFLSFWIENIQNQNSYLKLLLPVVLMFGFKYKVNVVFLLHLLLMSRTLLHNLCNNLLHNLCSNTVK